MSEIRTSLDFRQFIFESFQDSLDLETFLYEIQTLKNPNGTNEFGFQTEKSL